MQVASPSGRAVFELRGLPDNTTVDLKVCGPTESGGTMSIYRDGAFLWCATLNVVQQEQLCFVVYRPRPLHMQLASGQ